jgi:XRE family transcriptional regulator, regulator of sulfur utilization
VETALQTVVFTQFGSFSLPESGPRDANLLALGRAIRLMREQRGMSVDDLARAIHVRRQCLDALETGGLDPTYELVLAVAEGLGMQPSALVTLAEIRQRSR